MALSIRFNSYSDVNTFAGIVGPEGIRNAYFSGKLDLQDREWIKYAIERVNQCHFVLDEFNDGNNVWEESVYIDPDNIADSYYWHTMTGKVNIADTQRTSMGDKILDCIKLQLKIKTELSNLVDVSLTK